MNRIAQCALIGALVFLQACERDAATQAGPDAAAPAAPAPASAPESAQAEPAVPNDTAVPDARMAGILAGDHRSAENKARDQYRHPAETLAFFGLRPDSAVVEIWPGEGWYTEVIAPYVRGEGRFIAAGFDPESDIEFVRKGAAMYRAKLAERPDLYDHVEFSVLMPPDKLEIAPPESVDLVLTFRSVHNWMPRGQQDDVIAAIYRALKPGGIVGVEEHRGIASEPQDPEAKTGYVNQDYAIALFEKAGFVFDGSSEINANPADTKDHPQGVWSLPPTLREVEEQDRAKYLAIGESDRFTLRFRKPAAP